MEHFRGAAFLLGWVYRHENQFYWILEGEYPSTSFAGPPPLSEEAYSAPLKGELAAVRLTEGLSVILLKINFHAFQEGLSKKLTPPASAGAVPSRSR